MDAFVAPVAVVNVVFVKCDGMAAKARDCIWFPVGSCRPGQATQDELIAAEAYYERLVPQCIDKGMTFDERTKVTP